jgi:hypothetical protein
MIAINKEQLTNKLTRELFETIVNYETTLFDSKDVLKQLVFSLYDNDIINGTELEQLFNRIEIRIGQKEINNLKI